MYYDKELSPSELSMSDQTSMEYRNRMRQMVKEFREGEEEEGSKMNAAMIGTMVYRIFLQVSQEACETGDLQLAQDRYINFAFMFGLAVRELMDLGWTGELEGCDVSI